MTFRALLLNAQLCRTKFSTPVWKQRSTVERSSLKVQPGALWHDCGIVSVMETMEDRNGPGEPLQIPRFTEALII
jgi:hypothetical protein